MAPTSTAPVAHSGGAVTAAVAVLDIPELLESILLHLPLRDLLFAQRVNKSFKEAIAGSPSIQRALFFRPINDSTPLMLGVQPDKHFECKTKATCDYCAEHTFDDRRTPKWRCIDKPQSEYLVHLNPFVSNIEDFLMFEEYDERWRRSAASWRKMLLTQPPIEKLLVDDSSAYHRHTVRREAGTAGVTFAQVRTRTKDFHRTRNRVGNALHGTGLRLVARIEANSTAHNMLFRLNEAT